MKTFLLISLLGLTAFFQESFTGNVGEPADELKNRFEKIDGKELLYSELFKVYGFPHKTAPYGDFLSRIWFFYGETTDVGYDGYRYAFRHKPSGVVFSAYTGMGGPSFGGFPKDADQLKLILPEFEKLLRTAKYANCELTFDTDDGKMKVGAKNGKPYDKNVDN